MKKNYITPEINEIQLEAPLCNGGIVTASVHKGSTGGECIDKFDVVNEEKVKGSEYEDFLGSGNWGND